MIASWVVPLWLALMLALAVWIVQAVAREGLGRGGEGGHDGR